MSRELPDIQSGFRKGRGTRDQIANICRIVEKEMEFKKKKNSTSASLTYLPPEKPVCKAKKQQLEVDMEQRTGSRLGKEYVKAVYCHPACLTCM